MDQLSEKDWNEQIIPDKNITPQEKSVQRKFSELLHHNQEYQQSHNSYLIELHWLESIERGDVDMLEKCWKSEARERSFGILSKDPLRNRKYLCVVVISLACRAAIRGGVYPEESFSLCDCYIQELDKLREGTLCGQLAMRAQRNFAEMVHNLHTGSSPPHPSKGSPHITRCIDYIFANLHRKITVKEIADALYMNANYLSALFKKHEGRTILEYIAWEKMKLARNMLTYSQYTYSEIASYLGYSSQSHLGAQFKKITGMTMREYRVRYQLP